MDNKTKYIRIAIAVDPSIYQEFRVKLLKENVSVSKKITSWIEKYTQGEKNGTKTEETQSQKAPEQPKNGKKEVELTSTPSENPIPHIIRKAQEDFKPKKTKKLDKNGLCPHLIAGSGYCAKCEG